MKAIVMRGYGPPGEVLALQEVDTPAVAAGEVLVRVEAASANPADWHLVRGEPYVARLQLGLRAPKTRVLGCDMAGVVESTGPGVSGIEPGQEVFGCTFMRGFGAFAESVRVPHDLLVTKPAGLSFAEAAAAPLAGLTALQGLRDHGGVEAGQRLLVIGASGGVGTFAVQIGKHFGAEVTGVCSTRNVTLVRSLGADDVVDYTKEDVGGGGEPYDVVLQAAATLSPWASRRLLTPAGRLVQISGDSSGRWLGAVTRLISGRLLSPFMSQSVANFTVAPNRADLDHLRDLLESGAVRPVIDRSYPLAEVPAALEYLEAGHTPGKVVITV
jgi:NADPH:quinone reductase-like Zn-dependent oxidoreductase